MIKFNGLFGDSRHQGPYSPYKPYNHSLHIGISIFPHRDYYQPLWKWHVVSKSLKRLFRKLTHILKNSLMPYDTRWHQGYSFTLVQVMACCLAAPTHYLNQYWSLRNKLQLNLNKKYFSLKNMHFKCCLQNVSHFFLPVSSSILLSTSRCCQWSPKSTSQGHTCSRKSSVPQILTTVYS